MMDMAQILGVRIDDIAVEELLDTFATLLESQKKSVVSYVNIHALNLAYEEPRFRQLLNRTDLNLCDGVGVKVGGFMIGKKIKNRITPPDIMDGLCALLAQKHARIFLLGARTQVVERAAGLMRERFPGLCVQSHHGYFEKEREHQQNSFVIDKVNGFATDVLLVGFGMPAQEEWISENLPYLKVKIAFSVGALFDYVSGDIWRAPRWMTDNGLEWFGRLVMEPRRLWRRYVVGIPLFFFRLVVHHMLRQPLTE
jgi:N-acetylglucosaminyldiphosphoundecaprenol N-acetyl-beta-D-mannosaminyltransferase